jgi:hypothetical protein
MNGVVHCIAFTHDGRMMAIGHGTHLSVVRVKTICAYGNSKKLSPYLTDIRQLCGPICDAFQPLLPSQDWTRMRCSRRHWSVLSISLMMEKCLSRRTWIMDLCRFPHRHPPCQTNFFTILLAAGAWIRWRWYGTWSLALVACTSLISRVGHH